MSAFEFLESVKMFTYIVKGILQMVLSIVRQENCCELSKWPLNFITGVSIRERENFNPKIRVPEPYGTRKAKQYLKLYSTIMAIDKPKKQGKNSRGNVHLKFYDIKIN